MQLAPQRYSDALHLARWYHGSIFPEAFRWTQLLICGLAGFIASIGWKFIKPMLPDYLAHISSYELGIVAFLLTALVVLVIADAHRLKSLRDRMAPKLKVDVFSCCVGCVGVYYPGIGTIRRVYGSTIVPDDRFRRFLWLGEGGMIDIDSGGPETHRHIDIAEVHDGQPCLKLVAGFFPLEPGVHLFNLVIQAQDTPPTEQGIEIICDKTNVIAIRLVLSKVWGTPQPVVAS